MASMNKRQQARNERALQDLIKTVPGNDKCADCGARNPGWASWSLGIFLCMRCAALHRKMGTHISKVKSLSMDSWSTDQVERLKQTGNAASNKIYNPRNVKPSIPVDVDEVDGVMERFVRQKYEQKAYSNHTQPHPRHNTGSTSTSSAEDNPPPLPPKPLRRFHFGLRSTSAAPASRHHNFSPPESPASGSFNEQLPQRRSSKLFGLGNNSSNEEFDGKLATLREMGFPDEKRNSTILKGLNGNVDRTVEALIRLGEGADSRVPSRSQTPAPPPKNDVGSGITVERTRPATSNAAKPSYNPFDNLDAPQNPQQTQTQVPSGNPQYPPRESSNSYNPFFQNPQPAQAVQQPLDQSMQNLSLQPPPPQQPFRSQMFSPTSTNPFGAPPPSTNYSRNPWQPQSFDTIPEFSQPQQQQQMQQPPQAQFQQQQQDQFQQFPQHQYQQQQQFPFQQQQSVHAQTFPLQQQQFNPPIRHDKSSILALYNMPHLAPARPSDSAPVTPTADFPGQQLQSQNQPPQQQQYQPPQRSVTMPVSSNGSSGSLNPFASLASPLAHTNMPNGLAGAPMGLGVVAEVQREAKQANRDSTDFASGRHSPDAFAGLSARFVR
ncbi:ArfGap-domain-containing protein [Aulographum hederae CBS 113979]|uniref:ArfGap-domain-containing protein n=1 Tax=Aulographum hederae CBS 113979 TaxID=1176131 RepID=A0A6G1H438_9PEZI|nr:ArfGap-domain-containing protein [Aulographum hederae CBS 113979]